MPRLIRTLPLLLTLAGGLALAQSDEAPPTDQPGPGAPPPPGDPEKNGETEVQAPTADRPEDAPSADTPPKGSNSAPSGAVLMVFQGEVPVVDEAVTPQSAVADKSYVTWSGKASCTNCKGNLVLLVERKEVPKDGKLPRIVTSKQLDAAGNFELLVPEMDEPVILHLLVDEDGNGSPTRGERTAMLELAGKLIPNGDRSGLKLDATAQE